MLVLDRLSASSLGFDDVMLRIHFGGHVDQEEDQVALTEVRRGTLAGVS